MTALALATLSDAEREAIDRFVVAARAALGDDLHAVWLYGSRARGEAVHDESDVDLLAITTGGLDRDFAPLYALLDEAARAAGAEPACFSLAIFTPQRVENRREIRSFFFQEVDRDKIILHGTP